MVCSKDLVYFANKVPENKDSKDILPRSWETPAKCFGSFEIRYIVPKDKIYSLLGHVSWELILLTVVNKKRYVFLIYQINQQTWVYNKV